MFILQETPLDVLQIQNTHRNSHSGAMTAFEGIVRADKHPGKDVSSLLYIADQPACVKEGNLIIQEVTALYPDIKAICVQRIGQVNAGETAIWIGAWSAHRDEAFKGCRYIIEEVKKRLIIWKKESFTDGSSAWVHGPQQTSIRIDTF